MSLNARMSKEDPRLYHPGRDVAHNFKDVMGHVNRRLRDRTWPELEEFMVKAGVPDTEVDKAFCCLIAFVSSAYEKGKTSFETCFEETGWFELQPCAQIAVMATLGLVILGYHYTGVREVTLAGEGPAAELKDLDQLIRQPSEISRFLSLPRWRRKLRLWWARLRSRKKPNVE